MTDTLTETYGHVPSGARQIRTEVFVEEQGFCEEFDTIDHIAYHIVLNRSATPIATGRVFQDHGIWHIGRLAVRRPYRGEHLGARILTALEHLAYRHGATFVTLNAQLQARPFYAKQGYSPYGDPFLDENCPHIAMRKELNRS